MIIPPAHPYTGQFLVDAFDNVFGDETPICTAQPTMIDGRMLRCRVRQVLCDMVCPNLGWLRCMNSADYEFTSIEVHNCKSDAMEQHAPECGPRLIAAIWYQPSQYYTAQLNRSFGMIRFPDRIINGGEAECAGVLLSLIPFGLHR
jgi:hypothetical protein